MSISAVNNDTITAAKFSLSRFLIFYGTKYKMVEIRQWSKIGCVGIYIYFVSYFPKMRNFDGNISSCKQVCNEYPLTPHFYIVKLGLTGVYIIFLLACCQGSKPVLESFSDIQCVFLEDSRRHCIFL